MNAAIPCQICYSDIGKLSVQQRQLHYDHHFEQTETLAAASGSELPSGSSTNKKRNKFSPRQLYPNAKKFFKENDVFWYPSKQDPPPRNYTPGLIPLLRRSLLSGHSRGELRKAALCYNGAVFIQHEPWDFTWGCGYRNFLMACACLMVHPLQPMYFPLLDDPIPPSVRNLQTWIEDAWNRGFDPEGKQQLKSLIGTRKWLGTADLYVAFSSRGIPAELVDFTDASNVQVIIDWVVNYFTPPESGRSLKNAFEELKGASPVICTDRPPIILQHAGHSRSIVGYEIGKDGVINLLTFDSAISLPKEIRQMALSQVTDKRSAEVNKRILKRSSDENAESSVSRKKQRPSSPGADEIIIVDATEDRPGGIDDEIVITGVTSPSNKRKENKTAFNLMAQRSHDYRSIIRHFRLGSKKLGRNKQYQILYFPLTEPLSEGEILQRKTPTSTKIS